MAKQKKSKQKSSRVQSPTQPVEAAEGGTTPQEQEEFLRELAEETCSELIAEAYDHPPGKRAEYAREALGIDPTFVPAWILLGAEAPSPFESIALYNKAMDIAAMQLGEEFFEKNEGQFWKIPETRSFMTALAGAALTLYEMSQLNAAVELLQEALRLNPEDNQGLRFYLYGYVIELGEYGVAEQLLKQFKKEDGVGLEWSYSKALLSFAESGDTPQARAALAEAISICPSVATLLSKRKLPRPDNIGNHKPNSPEHAAVYCSYSMSVWSAIPNALEWVKKHGAMSVQ